MIRKLASGKYRVYSRRRIRRPAGGAISVPLPAAPPRRSTSAPCNFSSGVSPASRPRIAVRGTASFHSPMPGIHADVPPLLIQSQSGRPVGEESSRNCPLSRFRQSH